MTVSDSIILLSRWLSSDDRDDLHVALDGLEEAGLLYCYEPKTWFNVRSSSATPRDTRCLVVGDIVWNVLHELPVWTPTTDELRTALTVALQIRRQVGACGRKLGGQPHRIHLCGLARWAGFPSEPPNYFPNLSIVRRFVEGQITSVQFKQHLLKDLEREREFWTDQKAWFHAPSRA